MATEDETKLLTRCGLVGKNGVWRWRGTIQPVMLIERSGLYDGLPIRPALERLACILDGQGSARSSERAEIIRRGLR